VLIVLSALVIGVLAAMPAARRGDSRVGVALSGLMGPALFATASVLGAPRLGGAPLEQMSTLLVAPYAVIAGLAGSVIASVAFGTPRIGTAHPVVATASVPAPPVGTAEVSSVDKPSTQRQARNEAARQRAARDAEARQAAAQNARATGGTATAVATAPVETGGAHKAPESGWRRKLRPSPKPSANKDGDKA